MVPIRDDRGRLLALVDFASSADETTLVIARIHSGKGELLAHYFLKGERAIRMGFAEVELPGSLLTRWLGGGRMWAVRLTQTRREETVTERGVRLTGNMANGPRG